MVEVDTKHDGGLISIVLDLYENYCWYMLIGVIAIIYVANLLKPRINEYFERWSDQEYSAKYHRDVTYVDPELLVQRLEAQQKRVRQLQEQHQVDAESYQRKLEEREGKRLEELTRRYEKANVGEKLGSTLDKSGKSLKPEYNPLMGDTSRSYRPTKKSPCSGGGCGR